MGKYDDFKGQTFKIRNIIGEYLSTLTFKESHEIESVYNWDEDPDTKTTTATIGNANIKTG